MTKFRKLALIALSLASITTASTAFAGYHHHHRHCYVQAVWTYYGWEYQRVCY